MTAEIASQKNETRQNVSDVTMILTQHGKLVSNWREDDHKVFELDAYGCIVGEYVLGVNCSRVVRHRVTTIIETFTVEA